MKRLLSLLLILAVFAGSNAQAAGYEITKVVEVGPADWIPFIGPLKWSPDGTRLAYVVVSDGQIKIADTLGNTLQSIQLGWMPLRFNWASDSVIAAKLRARWGRDSTFTRISLFDINSGKETVVDRSRDRAPNVDLDGPYLTVEGNAFYTVTTRTGAKSTDRAERRWLTAASNLKKGDNHIIRWSEDGVYMVTLDGADSVRMAPNPFPEHSYIKPTFVSADGSYLMTGGLIARLADSSFIVLDTLYGEPPPGTSGCGYVFVELNPKRPEALFNLTCDDGHSYEVDRIGTFDLTSNEFTVLDTILGMQDCTTPVYSADGSKIAFLSGDKAWILYREDRR